MFFIYSVKCALNFKLFCGLNFTLQNKTLSLGRQYRKFRNTLYK